MILPTPTADPATSMSPDILVAYADIQKRLLHATSPFLIERYERALNEFIHHPDRVGTPASLANIASGNAGKVVRSRARRVLSLNATHDNVYNPDAQVPFMEVQLKCLVDCTCKTARDRMVVRLLMDGCESGEIARTLQITEGNARVLISRVRKRLQASQQ